MTIKNDQEEEYKKGLTFEKVPELLTRGHHVNEKRLGLLRAGYIFSLRGKISVLEKYFTQNSMIFYNQI